MPPGIDERMAAEGQPNGLLMAGRCKRRVGVSVPDFYRGFYQLPGTGWNWASRALHRECG
jgi:hypothetical protein